MSNEITATKVGYSLVMRLDYPPLATLKTNRNPLHSQSKMHPRAVTFRPLRYYESHAHQCLGFAVDFESLLERRCTHRFVSNFLYRSPIGTETTCPFSSMVILTFEVMNLPFLVPHQRPSYSSLSKIRPPDLNLSLLHSATEIEIHSQLLCLLMSNSRDIIYIKLVIPNRHHVIFESMEDVFRPLSAQGGGRDET